MSPLVDEVIRLSGLSPIFAKTVVRRVLLRARVDLDAARKEDFERALPELERAISVYIGAEAAERQIRAIKSRVLGS